MQWYNYIISYDAANLENVVKINFMCPLGWSWSIFAGLVTILTLI